MRKITFVVLSALMLAGVAPAAGDPSDSTSTQQVERVKEFVIAQRRSCKATSTCEEAVEMWCGGYSRADADGDGIPCENVCRSRSQVDAIKQRIGC